MLTHALATGVECGWGCEFSFKKIAVIDGHLENVPNRQFEFGKMGWKY
jgi:hypothetical protein